MTVLTAVAAAIFAIAALVVAVRVVRGPSLLDRMIAADVLITILLLIVGTEMVIGGHTRNLVIMLVIATTASIATISVARYVALQESNREEPDS